MYVFSNNFSFIISFRPKINANDNEQDIDFWTEHDRANDYIQKCLVKNQEKAAMFFNFSLKFLNFIKLASFYCFII